MDIGGLGEIQAFQASQNVNHATHHDVKPEFSHLSHDEKKKLTDSQKESRKERLKNQGSATSEKIEMEHRQSVPNSESLDASRGEDATVLQNKERTQPHINLLA